jgi:30S ribosomal protein S31
MGKGDKRTRRGKIFRGSYGAKRPKKKRRNLNQKINFVTIALLDAV